MKKHHKLRRKVNQQQERIDEIEKEAENLRAAGRKLALQWSLVRLHGFENTTQALYRKIAMDEWLAATGEQPQDWPNN